MRFVTLFYVTYTPVGGSKETFPVAASNMEEVIQGVRKHYEFCNISEVREGGAVYVLNHDYIARN